MNILPTFNDFACISTQIDLLLISYSAAYRAVILFVQ